MSKQSNMKNISPSQFLSDMSRQHRTSKSEFNQQLEKNRPFVPTAEDLRQWKWNKSVKR